jgi:flagellar motor protein MotB
MRSQNSRARNSSQVDEENPYWISFSDIMAALLIIFVLAAVALVLELTKKKEDWTQSMLQIQEADKKRQELIEEIAQELKDRGITVEVVDNDTVLRIPEDVLTFDSGSFELPPGNTRKNALVIGNVLFDSIQKDQRKKYLDTIFIEGHTDPDPFNNQAIKGNWGLSTFRAISIWDYWNTSMPVNRRLDSLSNHPGKKLFSVSGYAATRPVPCTTGSSEVTDPKICPNGELREEDSNAKNRRIDIRFTVRRPTQEDYQNIQRALN